MMEEFFAAHICSAYCRGARHAEIVWVPLEMSEAPEQNLRALCTAMDARFVHAEGAPEALPRGFARMFDIRNGTVDNTLADWQNYRAWLLILEVA